ncbi:MAG: histidine kinase [Flavobacteriales bacterium]|nr:histidine kinase [Flavobacteriales bacterium]
MDPAPRTPVRYRTILITAGVLATLFLFQAYMHHFVYRDLKELGPFNWWREAPVPYLNFFFWALLCPVVYRILRRWPFTHRPLAPVIALHLGLALVIAAVHEVVTSFIYYAILQSMGEFDFGDPFYRAWAFQSLAPGIFGRTMEYGVLMGVLVALENARLRRQEHEQLLRISHELQTTQLNALRKQLQPHFLFNTLNTVSALMDENVASARKVLNRLGRLLRVTLDKAQQDTITLERELEHVEDYLGIEGERFRDRLRVRFDIPASVLHVHVPGMLLQPLVENAIKHGPDAIRGGVEIVITAERRNGTLLLSVRDDGQGCADTDKAMSNGGIGLRNVRERLRLLYGEAADFRIASPGGNGFIADIMLPIEQRRTP